MRDEKLINSWIALANAEDGSKEYETNFWAHNEMWELNYENPEKAWDIILKILLVDNSTHIIELLSAGPLEDLLVSHGEQFIDRVEAEARRNPKFSQLLGGVWQNTMPDSIWNRVQAVWDRKGWDGIPNA